MERLKYVRTVEWLQRLRILPRPAIRCREVVSLVTNYLEGALTHADHARVESHLAACPHCGRYLEQMRLTIRATGSVREEDLLPEAKEALLGAFRNWKAN